MDLGSRWFDPLRPALSAIPLDPLPDAAALQRALGDRIAPFSFEAQGDKRERSLDALYEVRIARHHRIPTRANLHDLMNALVWASFPVAKAALAERQHRALVAQVGEQPVTLPNARTRERDVLAMIDEGGIAIARDVVVVFGHAILEHLATSETAVRGFPLHVDIDRPVDLAIADAVCALDTSMRPMAVRLTRTSASVGPDARTGALETFG